MINKKDGELISFQDEREFENLLPTVAEMIRQADEVKYVSDVSANMNLRLATSKDTILESSKVFEEKNISTLHDSIRQISNRVENISKQRQQQAIRESKFVAEVFENMRGEN